MPDPYHHPQTIITNNLELTGIAVWHKEDWVVLMGFWGDMIHAELGNDIEIQCSFDQLNTLLSELSQGSRFFREQAARAEEVMDELAELLTHPGEEEWGLLDLCEKDPLYFAEHVFSFDLLCEGADGDRYPREPRYELRGYTRRQKGWPMWEDLWLPEAREERSAYWLQLLVLHYGLFLAYEGRVPRPEALVLAGLSDPLLFELARVQYEQLEAAVQTRPEEFE